MPRGSVAVGGLADLQRAVVKVVVGFGVGLHVSYLWREDDSTPLSPHVVTEVSSHAVRIVLGAVAPHISRPPSPLTLLTSNFPPSTFLHPRKDPLRLSSAHTPASPRSASFRSASLATSFSSHPTIISPPIVRHHTVSNKSSQWRLRSPSICQPSARSSRLCSSHALRRSASQPRLRPTVSVLSPSRLKATTSRGSASRFSVRHSSARSVPPVAY